METTPKIAIYVDGGIIQAIRSNISPEIEIEIVDNDTDPETAENRWKEIQSELGITKNELHSITSRGTIQSSNP